MYPKQAGRPQEKNLYTTVGGSVADNSTGWNIKKQEILKTERSPARLRTVNISHTSVLVVNVARIDLP